jgi:hypothetical protein
MRKALTPFLLKQMAKTAEGRLELRAALTEALRLEAKENSDHAKCQADMATMIQSIRAALGEVEA